jgi:hypothetical protein
MNAMAEKPEPTFWDVFLVGMALPYLLAAYFLPVVILKSWVISWLWHWYAVPVFHVPELRLVFAFGINLMVSYILPTVAAPTIQKKLAEVLLAPIVYALLTVSVGWLGSLLI